MALLGSVLALGCFSEQHVAAYQFGKTHPDCPDKTVLRDADGTYHVLGCGSVETYQCTTTSELIGYRYEPVYSPLPGDSYYDAAGRPATAPSSDSLRNGGSREQLYERHEVLKYHTDCKSDNTPSGTGKEAWREPPPNNQAPPIEVRTEQGHVKLRLDLVLNRRALLTLSASPSERSDRVNFRVAWQQVDQSQDSCPVRFIVNTEPFATPPPRIKRKEDMLSQELFVAGDQLGNFDQIRKLSVATCSRQWFLSREQILRLRELMARFRHEVALSATPAPPVTPPSEPTGTADTPPSSATFAPP